MKLSLDRYEGDYCVFTDDDGLSYDYLKSDLNTNLKIGDVIEAEILDGKIVSFSLIECERERIAKENRSILQRLKNRKKKREGESQ